jgi:hypothetical protein
MTALLRRSGRRGGFLLFLALLDLVYAWGIWISVAPQSHQPNMLLPAQAWAAAWAVTGVICLTGVLLNRDRIMFAAAAAMKTSWCGLSMWLWTSGQQPNGWLSAVVWGAFAATVLMVGSWPEPPPKIPDLPEDVP